MNHIPLATADEWKTFMDSLFAQTDTPESLRADYVAGRITVEQFERRLELHFRYVHGVRA
jgi:heme oxygenase